MSWPNSSVICLFLFTLIHSEKYSRKSWKICNMVVKSIQLTRPNPFHLFNVSLFLHAGKAKSFPFYKSSQTFKVLSLRRRNVLQQQQNGMAWMGLLRNAIWGRVFIHTFNGTPWELAFDEVHSTHKPAQASPHPASPQPTAYSMLCGHRCTGSMCAHRYASMERGVHKDMLLWYSWFLCQKGAALLLQQCLWSMGASMWWSLVVERGTIPLSLRYSLCVLLTSVETHSFGGAIICASFASLTHPGILISTTLTDIPLSLHCSLGSKKISFKKSSILLPLRREQVCPVCSVVQKQKKFKYLSQLCKSIGAKWTKLGGGDFETIIILTIPHISLKHPMFLLNFL